MAVAIFDGEKALGRIFSLQDEALNSRENAKLEFSRKKYWRTYYKSRGKEQSIKKQSMFESRVDRSKEWKKRKAAYMEQAFEAARERKKLSYKKKEPTLICDLLGPWLASGTSR